MTYNILSGVKVVELSTYWAMPSAAALLSDWGASVVKVEGVTRGDALRGMRLGVNYVGPVGSDRNFMFEQANRNKQGVALDLGSEAGRDVFYEIIRHADVFITNYLTKARKDIDIDVDKLRGINPGLIYARCTGQGTKGAEAEKGGFDSVTSWYRGGYAYLHRASVDDPPVLQPPGYGDSLTGVTMAGGIAAALYKRATTGEPSVVDVSLLASTIWMLAPDTVGSKVSGQPRIVMGTSQRQANPIARSYQTNDGKWLRLSMFHVQHWVELVRALGREDLATDPRFVDTQSMEANYDFAAQTLSGIFGAHTEQQVRELLSDIRGVFGFMQSPLELHDDPQVIANQMIEYKTLEDGSEIPVVPTALRFDEQPVNSGALAPRHGEHTDQVLQEMLGWDMDKVIDLKVQGAIL